MILGVALMFPADELEGLDMATAEASAAAWGGSWAGQLIVLGGIAGILSSWNAFLVGASRVIYALAKRRAAAPVACRIASEIQYTAPRGHVDRRFLDCGPLVR